MKQALYIICIIFSVVSCQDFEDYSSNVKSQSNMRIFVNDDAVIGTRAILQEQEHCLDVTYEEGDSALACYMEESVGFSLLTYNSTEGCFQGMHIQNISDEIAVLTPYVESGNGHLLCLPLPYQDGTARTLADNIYRWGFTSLSMENNEYIGEITFSSLMTALKLIFYDDNDEVINNIVSLKVKALKGAFYSNRDINLYAGTFEDGEMIDEFTIVNKHGMCDAVGYVYIMFFPTAVAMEITIEDADGNEYVAEIEQNRYLSNQISDLDLHCQQTKCVVEKSDYIEICGVKWAKGNLQYDDTYFGNNGCQEHWFIASNQWYYPNAVSGTQNATLEEDNHKTCLFNWGVCGVNAISNSLYGDYIGDITGKMFTDRKCTMQTTSRGMAEYGDVAYWATNGEYRMPTEDEMYKLYSEASYSYGFYTTNDGIKVFGYLFKNPEDGKRVVESGFKEFTDDDLVENLFLPAAGYRQARTRTLMGVGSFGFYYHGERTSDMQQMLYKTAFFTWRTTSASYGRAIRPVKNEDVPHQEQHEYIELCGAKWALGNLQYGNSLGTTEGFRENWSIASEQWCFPDAGHGYQTNYITTQNPSAVCHFNWGVCGNNAISQKEYATCYGNISSKMYSDRECTIETADFDKAQYGDIAYWASNGKWRLPSEQEMYRLFSEASYSYGCYIDNEGNETFGFLFWESDDTRQILSGMHYYTDADLVGKLFLPCAGNRQIKSDDIYRVGGSGYYWSSSSDLTSELEQISLIYNKLVWRVTSAIYGRTIRPVLND